MGNVGSFPGVQAAEELGRKLLSSTIYRTCNGNNQVQGNKFKKELIFLDATAAFSAVPAVSTGEITLRLALNEANVKRQTQGTSYFLPNTGEKRKVCRPTSVD